MFSVSMDWETTLNTSVSGRFCFQISLIVNICFLKQFCLQQFQIHFLVKMCIAFSLSIESNNQNGYQTKLKQIIWLDLDLIWAGAMVAR